MSENKAYHHGDLRSALIDAARKLIGEKGPRAISLREVAKAAGVSHAAPYRHFKDKDELLASIAELGFRRLADRLEEITAQVENTREQLLESGKAYVRLALAAPEITLLMFGGYVLIGEPNPELQRSADRAYQGLIRVIENGIATGLYIEKSSSDLAMAVWSLVHGFSLLAIGNHVPTELIDDTQNVDTLSQQLCEMLLQGIARQ